MGRVDRRKKKKKPMKLWAKILLIVIAMTVLGTSAYAYSIYHNAKKTVDDKMHEQVGAIDIGVTKKKLQDKKPLHILLLGVDAKEGESGRSDAMMVLTVDPKGDQMQLISIPRDTRVPIAGRGEEDKINHANAFGGHDMAAATVEDFLGIELDYYVSINMDGFEELVDQLGGITVMSDKAWSDEKFSFSEGQIEMDGRETMGYVRMRKEDPEGDFGRTKRQRQVMQGIVDKGATVGSVTKINGLIDILGDNMSTNMDFDDMMKLLSDYRDTRKNFTDYQMEGEGTNIDGVYYLIISDEEVEKVRSMMEDLGS